MLTWSRAWMKAVKSRPRLRFPFFASAGSSQEHTNTAVGHEELHQEELKSAVLDWVYSKQQDRALETIKCRADYESKAVAII